jgi:small basic protein (TIGR04137 family)
MSIDRSLRVKGALARHRNVLSRGERIEKLKQEERWEDERSVLGLPKVSHRKAGTGKKGAEKTTEDAAAPGAAAPAAAAGGTKAAAGAAKAAPVAKAAPAAKAAGKK